MCFIVNGVVLYRSSIKRINGDVILYMTIVEYSIKMQCDISEGLPCAITQKGDLKTTQAIIEESPFLVPLVNYLQRF